LRQAPFAGDGTGRNLNDNGSFFDAQSAEETQLDDLAFTRVELRKFVERIIQINICRLVSNFLPINCKENLWPNGSLRRLFSHALMRESIKELFSID
jgi:hypothetical protein